MIKQIKFASIAVTDQDRALAFWRDVMGFDVRTDQPFDEHQRWIELGIPGAQTRLVLFTPPGHETRIGSFSNVTFQADDVEATYELLKKRGVDLVGEPQKADWGTSVQFRDPDGNVFLISSK